VDIYLIVVNVSCPVVFAGYIVDQSVLLDKKEVAYVSPVDQASDVTLSLGGEISATNGFTADDVFGTIKFTEHAQHPTPPASSPTPDTQITAKIGDSAVLGQSPVLVYEPYSVINPNPAGTQTSAIIAPKNLAVDSTTVPADFTVAPPYVDLSTEYLPPPTTVHVNDQFGELLDSMFNGADVKEQFPFGNPLGSWDPINVSISNGSYSDEVFVYSDTNNSVLANNDAANNWVNVDQPLDIATQTGLLQDTYPASMSVEVGGVQLNPGIVGRSVGWSEPNGAKTPVTITITW
jgi:hypothetical protein